jgi:hypothetical protein
MEERKRWDKKFSKKKKKDRERERERETEREREREDMMSTQEKDIQQTTVCMWRYRYIYSRPCRNHFGTLRDNWRMQMAATTFETPSTISAADASNVAPTAASGMATHKTTTTAPRKAIPATFQMVSRAFFLSLSDQTSLLWTSWWYCPMMTACFEENRRGEKKNKNKNNNNNKNIKNNKNNKNNKKRNIMFGKKT